MLQSGNIIAENALNMPNILADFKTGLDVFQLETCKLESAPAEWNFYSELSNEKMFELVNSIKDVGLLHPIVVWERENGNYMILSGHSRKKAYDILFEQTNDPQYKKIYCYIKKKNDILEDEAKEIIIDTNWVQRQLSSIERAKSIFEKYTSIGRKKKSKKGEGTSVYTRDIIAKQYKISNRHVSNYYRLNFLINDLKLMVEQNIISIKSGVKLSNFDEDTQRWLFETHAKDMNNSNISKIDIKMGNEDINNVFRNKNKSLEITYRLKIPEQFEKTEFEKEFTILLNKYNISTN